MAKLFDRPLREIMIIMLTGTVCLSVLGAGLSLLIIEFIDPTEDLTNFYGALFGLVGSLVSVVAGFLAGQSSSKMTESEKTIARMDAGEDASNRFRQIG